MAHRTRCVITEVPCFVPVFARAELAHCSATADAPADSPPECVCSEVAVSVTSLDDTARQFEGALAAQQKACQQTADDFSRIFSRLECLEQTAKHDGRVDALQTICDSSKEDASNWGSCITATAGFEQETVERMDRGESSSAKLDRTITSLQIQLYSLASEVEAAVQEWGRKDNDDSHAKGKWPNMQMCKKCW
eukprot:TRINITY_DN53165_c0_g1_i1.p1 TRINITY_DN53165_c0_g1~~TRINITY_DN53165_c0_g1_i1.p1  ORF type:complete len:216 (-),score=27.14 TRINITY_DN53165_c0_g1_i1:63-641(-)